MLTHSPIHSPTHTPSHSLTHSRVLAHAGDVASIDRHGYMRIQDRSKDVVKSGGEWISSIALENAAMGHPQVCAGVKIPDHPGTLPQILRLPPPKPLLLLSFRETLTLCTREACSSRPFPRLSPTCVEDFLLSTRSSTSARDRATRQTACYQSCGEAHPCAK